jgi:riboflavin kinase/FMN adenylyltransferase
MRVIYSLDEAAPSAEVALTIGSFDGVHRGHHHLLQGLVERARQTARLSAALTFDPHPRALLHPELRPAYLTTPAERAAILDELGLDLLVQLPFTRELADTPATRFVSDLYQRLRLRELWVGPDFALGRDRDGDITQLQELATRLGYTLQRVAPLYEDGEAISSTRIRRALLGGRMEEVTRLLGRPYAITEQVQPGAQRGRTLGFRTANLRVDPARATPPNGVYAVWAISEGQRYQGVANLGVRPSFDSGERLIETHLMDYQGDLYDRLLTIAFVRWLRPEMRFESGAALAEQIHQDIAAARVALGAPTPGSSGG